MNAVKFRTQSRRSTKSGVAHQRMPAGRAKPVGHRRTIGQAALGGQPVERGSTGESAVDHSLQFKERRLPWLCQGAKPDQNRDSMLAHDVQPFRFLARPTPQMLTSSSLRGTVPAVGRLGDIFMSGASR